MRRIVPKQRRKWPLAGMLVSMVLVAASAFLSSLPRDGQDHSTHRIAIVAGSAGLVGGLVSWVVSRND